MNDGTPHALSRLQSSIDRLEKHLKTSKKDGWDKAGVLAQFLSGTVIGLVGLLISCSVQKGQRLDTERQQFSAYLTHIVNAADEPKRSKVIGALDLALTDRADVISLASSYATDNNSTPVVREDAIRMLGKYPEGKPTLQEIANGSMFPNRQLAAMALGIKVKELLVRLSDIDDDGYLFINHAKVAEAHTGGPRATIQGG